LFDILLVFSRLDGGGEANQGSIAPLPRQGIPEQIELHEILAGQESIALLEPIEHQLFLPILLDQDAIDRNRRPPCSIHRQIKCVLGYDFPSSSRNAALRGMG
jgi:hypothetical protein